ncbi:MAG: MAPEG family protein [Rhodospirillales bacterium]
MTVPITVTPLYAAVLALVFVVLSLRVIGRRRQARVALGPGDDQTLMRRIRAHGNFAEYAPMVLVLMLVCEFQGVSAPVLHGLGIAFLAGRLLHAANLSSEGEVIRLRVVAMMLTFTVLVTGALLALWGVLQNL